MLLFISIDSLHQPFKKVVCIVHCNGLKNLRIKMSKRRKTQGLNLLAKVELKHGVESLGDNMPCNQILCRENVKKPKLTKKHEKI